LEQAALAQVRVELIRGADSVYVSTVYVATEGKAYPVQKIAGCYPRDQERAAGAPLDGRLQ